MASALQQVVADIQLSKYASGVFVEIYSFYSRLIPPISLVVTLTAVAYDYGV